jgi:hypothetical protein
VNALPQPFLARRAPRLKLAEITPAVLRLQDGRRVQGRIEVVSLTGGLLHLSKALHRDFRVKLMFVMPSGPVSGTAEMLKPLSSSQQPFRFIGLDHEDQRRLRESTHSPSSPAQNSPESERGGSDDEWIEKYRATLDQQHAPRGKFFRTLLAAVTVAVLCLGSAIYLFSIHVK